MCGICVPDREGWADQAEGHRKEEEVEERRQSKEE